MVLTGREYSVLVVEDDPGMVEVVEEHLSRAGYNVRTAANGWDALKCLKEGKTDLVVSELDLADTDGSGLRERFLLNPGMRDIPFLYLAPEGLSESQIQGLRAGVDGFLVKPFDPLVLVAHAQAAIERRRIYEEMVRVDSLTRVLNRRTLENGMRDELERVRRYRRFGCVVLMDLDDFGRVNEEQGQAMGRPPPNLSCGHYRHMYPQRRSCRTVPRREVRHVSSRDACRWSPHSGRPHSRTFSEDFRRHDGA